MDQFFKDLENKGWEFKNYSMSDGFEFKSPRMKLYHYYDNSIGELEKYEIECVLKENAKLIERQCEDLKNDILRQFEILLRRNQDLPTELKVTIDLNFN